MSDSEIIKLVKSKLNEKHIVGIQCVYECEEGYIAFGDKELNGYNCNGIMISKKMHDVWIWLPDTKECHGVFVKAR